MRGLPPVPNDVAHLVQDVSVNDYTVSIGVWLFNPSMPSLESASAAVLLGDWFLGPMADLLPCMHAGATFTTCRLSTSTFAYVESAPTNVGEWTGGLANHTALGLHWIGAGRGRALRKIMFVPAVPDVFVDHGWQLNQLGYGNLQASGRDFYAHANTIRAPDGTPCVFGTVHRSAAGAPLAVASFDPYTGVVPTAKVVTIRRRIPRRPSLSPS